jgi:hypothetical protein
MGAFGSLIGGLGQGAAQYGQQERQNRYQHQENELNRWQTQHQALADAVERAAGKYQGAEGERLRDLQMEVNALRPGADLGPYFTKYSQHRQKAEQEIAQNAVQGAKQAPAAGAVSAPPSQIPMVGGVQPNAGGGFHAPAPFAPLIAQAQPPPTPAAQPNLSPVQPQAQGGGSSSSATFQSPTGGPSPVPVQPNAGGPSSAGLGAPVPNAPQIDQAPGVMRSTTLDVPPLLDLHDLYGPSVSALHNTGYIDPLLEMALPKELERQTAITQVMQTGQINQELARRKIEAMQDSGILDNLPPALRASAQAGAYGIQIPGIANLMKPINLPGVTPSTSLPPGTTDAMGQVIDPKETPYVRARQSLLTGETEYYPVVGVTKEDILPDKNSPTGYSIVVRDRSGNELGRTLGAKPPVLGSTSTQVSPGAPPVTTIRTPVNPLGVAPSAATPPPVSTGGAKSTTKLTPSPGPQSAGSALEKLAQDVRDGKRPLPSDMRSSLAVQDIMAKKGWEVPTPYSPVGQKAIASIDPIIDEVKRVQQMMDESGIAKMGTSEGKKRLAENWIKYNYLHLDSPDTALISSLSFADLRSAAQALAGTGSRAYPILNRALEHTPVIGINSDEPAMIVTKLKEMETRLMEARQAVIDQEKKSGVITPLPGAPKSRQQYSTGDPEADKYLNGR